MLYFKFTKTLEKARKKAENANYTTSCDETKERGKRIIYDKVDIYDSSDDCADSGNFILSNYISFPLYLKKFSFHINIFSSCANDLISNKLLTLY